MLLLFMCCTSPKNTLSPFIAIYKSSSNENIPPTYILLRTQPKVFEVYSPVIHSGTFGEWRIQNDTLLLSPKSEFLSRNSTIRFSKITPMDTSVSTIPQQYLIKNDCLIDITDYNTILPSSLNNQAFRAKFYRVNNQ